jgi:hypothetical protein
MDLETHRSVDLLRGREAATLAGWVRQHPGVEVIARDRSEAYAQGGREGAPQARQVAGRFHLVQNASEALDELLRSRQRVVTVPDDRPDPLPADKPLSATKQREARRRATRAARWEAVQRLHAAGESQRGSARELGINRQTVSGLLAAPTLPERQVNRPRPSGLSSPSLQPFVTYRQDRWQAGCENISQLYGEIHAQGYRGSRSLLY